MASKRTPLLSTFMHILTLVALAALVFMVFYTYAYGPAGGSFSLRSIHYTFKALHQQGSVWRPGSCDLRRAPARPDASGLRATPAAGGCASERDIRA
jgi:hypothetical protein